VVDYTIRKVKQGLTPNPDVMCNKLIKFGVFERVWVICLIKRQPDITLQPPKINGKTYLSTAKDPVKDQTDFLAQIDHLQISKLMFPIGHLMKNEVRDIAREANLPSAKRQDSQGICFLGKVNYNDFIRRYLGEKQGPMSNSKPEKFSDSTMATGFTL
jgi:tRNA-specific 2-thiouridylase